MILYNDMFNHYERLSKSWNNYRHIFKLGNLHEK